jgi:DNA-entry nuclease
MAGNNGNRNSRKNNNRRSRNSRKYGKTQIIVYLITLILLSILALAVGVVCEHFIHAGGQDSGVSPDETGLTEVADNGSDKGYVFSLDDVPPYSGSPYADLNGSIPVFSDEDKACTEAFEIYSGLDRLGRCGTAYANICPELMPAEKRNDISQIRPAGWHSTKYEGVVDQDHLYNRCHLIAHSLAGEDANALNLVTGTRYMNTEGMQPFEIKVADYVRYTKNHVLYRSTPVFKGKDLIPAGVHIEAWSVEDGGEGICFNVFCYDVQPNIRIDYATGDSSYEEGFNVFENSGIERGMPVTEDRTTGLTDDFADKKTSFILNVKTQRIHLPSCESVDEMNPKNKREITAALSELKDKGYIPCGRCLAEYR